MSRTTASKVPDTGLLFSIERVPLSLFTSSTGKLLFNVSVSRALSIFEM